MSYLVLTFLAGEVPSADEARAYLLEGALFDQRPQIEISHAANGAFERMELRYDPTKRPMVLRRVTGEQADAARGEAIDAAQLGGREDIAAQIEHSHVVLEWEVDRGELDEDAWFALHLWQAWVLGQTRGWLHAPGDGLFDVELKRVIPAEA
ncbi:MAG: hypothetical protein WKG01_10050 [Kofleriaceae bacterium]